MKPSRYNHSVKQRGKPEVLYNSRRHTLLLLDQGQSAIFGGLQMPITRNLMNFRDPGIESLVSRLMQGGFMVDDGTDELLELELASTLFRFSTRRLDLWVCLTTRCDRGCPDCPYSQGRSDLPLQAWETVKSLISQRPELRQLSLTFWGGEPTLAWPQYLEFRQWLEGLKKVMAFGLDVGVVTSGGPAHLAAINKHPQWVPDRIFVNLDEYERSTTLGGNLIFLAGLESAGSRRQQLPIKGKMKIIPGRPSERLCRNLAGLCQSAPRFSDEEMDAVRNLTSSGVELLNLPRPKVVPCQAADPQSFIIDAGGAIFKCWEEVGLADCALDPGLDDPFSLRMFRWMSWNPHRQPHCRICGLLPWCQGGCLAKPPEDDCGLWHYSKNDLLKLLAL